MKIEVLYSEVCNLFGDLANATYIAKSNDIEIVYTSLLDKPRFVDEDIALVYMASTTESGQVLARNALKPYINDLKKRIKDNKVTLFTGNSIEILCDHIDENGTKIEMLGLYPFVAKRDGFNRYNSLWLGKYEDMKLVGFKAQFGHLYGDNSNNYCFETIRGDGLNLETKPEGFKENNLYCTYVIGPLLVLNPDFAKYILKQMGVTNPKLDFEDLAYDSYNQRLKDFEEPTRGYLYH